MQNLGADAVVAKVVRVAELEVGFHSVQPLFLELVGLEFCRQADAAAFLAQVEEHAAFLRNAAHGGVELAAAVAPAGAEDVPVRHSLCTRTSVGLSGEISPCTRAR